MCRRHREARPATYGQSSAPGRDRARAERPSRERTRYRSALRPLCSTTRKPRGPRVAVRQAPTRRPMRWRPRGRCGHQAEIHEAWSFLTSTLLGHRFAAMKVETDSLAYVEPIQVARARSSIRHVFHEKPNTGCDRGDVRWWQDRFLPFGQRVCATQRKIVSAEALLAEKCAN
jgi:hypothetical protein